MNNLKVHLRPFFGDLCHSLAFLIYHKIKSILVYTKRAIMASFSCVSYHENSIRKYGVHYDLFKLYYKYY